MRILAGLLLLVLSVPSSSAADEEGGARPPSPGGRIGPYLVVGNADLTRVLVLDSERRRLSTYVQDPADGGLRLVDDEPLRGIPTPLAAPRASAAPDPVPVPGEDVPGFVLPDGAVRIGYGRTRSESTDTQRARYSVPAAAADVHQWVREHLEGWSIEAEDVSGEHGNGSLRARRSGETLDAMVRGTPRGPGARSTLELSWKRPLR